MTNLTNLLNQRNDVLSEVYHLIKNTRFGDLPYAQGPFSRSSCYARKRDFFSKGIGLRVFMLHDCVDKYYLVSVHDFTGQNLYDTLVSHRSLIRRLDKEIEKL